MEMIKNDFKKVIFDSIPDGLKKYDQWVLSCKKGVPLYENDKGGLVNASPISGPWYSFKKVTGYTFSLFLDGTPFTFPVSFSTSCRVMISLYL